MSTEHNGQGGSYVIDESGERKLVERTRAVGEVSPDPLEPDDHAPQDDPADAGFFSPVAPADQSTTTE